MEEKISMSDKLICNNPNLIPLCGYYRPFEWRHVRSWFSSRCRGGILRLWKILRGRECRVVGMMDIFQNNLSKNKWE